MYQALYRKYRPASFDQVVGQDGVTKTLIGQLSAGKVGHAYLFTGTRGTGKTTCAKILAKAVNCEHPVNGNPCNECAACKAIASGSTTEIFEIDAASNNGVDDVRDLRQDIVYPPATLKYKVYIIDEVHRLSPQAFDAFLKTVEEPPEYVIFIFATTELHKVPATILSRCQRLDFRRIDAEEIAARLRFVAEKENIDLSEDGARLLARMGQGSMRDALSLLERATALQGKVDAAAVGELLGLCDPEKLLVAVEDMAQGNTGNVLKFFDEMWRSSKDIGRLISELAVLLREIALCDVAEELVTHTPEEVQRMKALLHSLGRGRVLGMLETLQKGIRDISLAADERIMTEITLMRLCDERLDTTPAALLSRIEVLEKAEPRSAPTPPAVARPTPKPKQPPADPPKPKAPTGTAVSKVPEASDVPTTPADTALWQSVMEFLRKAGRMDLVAGLSALTPEQQGDRLIVRVDGMLKERLKQAENCAALKEALFKADGGKNTLRICDALPPRPERDGLDDLIDTVQDQFGEEAITK